METLYYKGPFQSVFAIKTNCPKLINLVKLKFGSYINNNFTEQDFTINIIKYNNTYLFNAEHQNIITNNPLLLIDEFINKNNKYSESIFALHGSAIEWKGQAYIFLAPTTSGKTTLASYLTSNQFGYITDDCILIDRNTFMVYPFYTPIHLRAGGLQVLESYNTVPQNLSLLKYGNIQRYVYTPDNIISQNIPIGKIFFIHRTSEMNKIQNLNGYERIYEFLKSPIVTYEINSKYLKFISRLSEINCQKLFYSNLEYVIDIIKNN